MADLVPMIAGKGGVGKTTTAVNLAAGLSGRGYRTLLADLDRQDGGGALSWLQRRRDESSLRFDFDKVDIALVAKLRQLPYDVVIVDTPAYLSPGDLRSILAVATCAVALTSYRPPEIDAFLDIYATTLRPTGAPFKALLARVDSRRLTLALATRQQLHDAGIPVFGPLVRSYTIHEDAYAAGRTIFEMSGPHNSEAQGDYAQVISELSIHLEGARR